jgi:glycosyltransferase involved in cell wall biosynthesis
MNTAILIPAYEPDERLIRLVRELSKMEFPLILVVNDGSSANCDKIFSAVEEISGCRVIRHKANRGKGAALKTGLMTILSEDRRFDGCITVDADGQHLPEDIIKTAKVFEKNSNSLVLGCRNFSEGNVPFKSRFGNLLTRAVYRLSTGKAVTDTQTGVRAIPADRMKNFLELPGDHYEFEMNMLMHASRTNIPIEEVEIQTVYINQNRASHFNPLLDSARIYKEIIKFSLSSLSCSAIDIGLFSLAYWLLSAGGVSRPLLGATVFARMISSSVNFTLNKKIVFQNKASVATQAVKYYLLCGMQMLCSWLLLEGFTLAGLGNVVLLKVLADTILFFISFAIQQVFIFRRKIPYGQNA